MSFDTKSEYALGKKNKTTIIYQDAYGNITALTQDDFESQKEFRKWRNWNIMKSHTVEKKEHIHRNYTLSMTGFEEYLSNLPAQYAAATSEDTPSEAAPEVIVPHIPFHGLRHTSATLLIAAHQDVRTVSNRLGHAQASTTMNIYAHALKENDRTASNALENMLCKNGA